MAKGFYIEITNNLLEPKHRLKMKESVWLFMWFLDKITSVSEDGIGKVLGGKPIKYEEVNTDLAIPERTYTRWIAQLKKSGYINIEKAPYGIIIYVNKAKKRFHQKSYAKNGVTDRDTPKMAEPVPPKSVESSATKVGSNKTRQGQDNIVVSKDTTTEGSEKPFNLNEEIKKLEDNPRREFNIIALLAEKKKPEIRNYAQYQKFLKRHLRAAKELTPFDDDQIVKAVKQAEQEYPQKWQLETLLKILTK